MPMNLLIDSDAIRSGGVRRVVFHPASFELGAVSRGEGCGKRDMRLGATLSRLFVPTTYALGSVPPVGHTVVSG